MSYTNVNINNDKIVEQKSYGGKNKNKYYFT